MKNYSTEQSGRSMIEMLGVLAIVGVLSVAGIAGYSKAMAKFKTNKLVDQITSLSSSVKTMFAGAGTYTGLTTQSAFNLGLIPDDATKACKGTYSSTCIKHALNGDLTVAVNTDTRAFDILINGLTKDACASLVSSDWGGPTSVKGVTASSAAGADGSLADPTDASKSITEAAKCSCAASECSVRIVYY